MLCRLGRLEPTGICMNGFVPSSFTEAPHISISLPCHRCVLPFPSVTSLLHDKQTQLTLSKGVIWFYKVSPSHRARIILRSCWYQCKIPPLAKMCEALETIPYGFSANHWSQPELQGSMHLAVVNLLWFLSWGCNGEVLELQVLETRDFIKDFAWKCE